MSDSDRPDSARTVVGFPTDGAVAAPPPSPITSPRGWPPRPPLPERPLPEQPLPEQPLPGRAPLGQLLPQKTTKMAVVPPLPLAPPSDEDDPDEEPSTQPRPEAGDAPSLKGPRGRRRSRDGTMEIHAVDDLAPAPPAVARALGRKTVVIDGEDEPVSGDEDTRKQARRRPPAATMMLADLSGSELPPEPSASAVVAARAAAAATTEMQAFPVMLPADVMATVDGDGDGPRSNKTGTAKIAQVEAAEAEPRVSLSPRPRTRARTVPVPDEARSARLRTTTLKSSEEAAEIAALRAQYAHAIRVPMVEEAADEEDPPAPHTPNAQATSAAGTAVDRLPLSLGQGSALSESFDDADSLALSSTQNDEVAHAVDPAPSARVTVSTTSHRVDAAGPTVSDGSSSRVADEASDAPPKESQPSQSLARPSLPKPSLPKPSLPKPSHPKPSLRDRSAAGPRSSRPSLPPEAATAPPSAATHEAPDSAPELQSEAHPAPSADLAPAVAPALSPTVAPPNPTLGELADHDDGASSIETSRDDPFSIEDEPTAPESAEAVSEDDTVDRKRDFDLAHAVAPAAMRPIGRLGGDDGGSGLALDFSKPGVIIDEETVSPSQRPPPLPGGHACEADRLDAWLDALDGEPVATAAALPATQAPGTMDVAAVFGNLARAALPFDDASHSARLAAGLGEDTPPPAAIPKPRRTAATQALSLDQFQEALPFLPGAELPRFDPAPTTPAGTPETGPPRTPAPLGSPFDPSEADRLEQWLRGHLDVDAPAGAVPWPLTAHQPVEVVRAIAPNPIRDARIPMVAPQPPSSLARSEPASQVLLLSIEAYAQVKVAVWDRNLDLLAALDELDVEEPKWRDNELRVADALAREARDGQAQLATALRQAIRTLRAATRGDEELVPLERYAEARVALEAARVIDEAPELVLARLELSPESWETARAAWAKRARHDPGLAREVRRAVAKARRDAKARARAERGAASVQP